MSTDATYWNARYQAGHSSGPGSADGPVLRKVEWLRDAKMQGVKTISEIGCGDFNFGKRVVDLSPTCVYRGYDISAAIVGSNQAKFGQPDRVNFYTIEKPFRQGDLLLCVDVLFHISDDAEYAAMLESLKRAWTKYLAVSAYEYEGQRRGHVHIRKFDPSFFGDPILREIVEEDGSMYFYIFKK